MTPMKGASKQQIADALKKWEARNAEMSKPSSAVRGPAVPAVAARRPPLAPPPMPRKGGPVHSASPAPQRPTVVAPPMPGNISHVAPPMPARPTPMKKGGKVKDEKKYASGGKVAASKRGDGVAQRGKTKGRFI